MPDGVMGGRQNVRVLALGVNWFAAGSGGLDRVFHDLALAFPQAGVDMQGLVLGPPDARERSFGQVQAFGRGGRLPSRLWQARQAIAAQLASAPPDLTAVHFALFAFPALDLLTRQPMVMHFHGPWADEAAAEGAGRIGWHLRHRMERAVYRRASRVITLSHAFATQIAQSYGVDPASVRVVPGSVDVARLAPTMSRAAARARLGWPENARVLLSVRRLVKRMGLDRLIEAMPGHLCRNPRRDADDRRTRRGTGTFAKTRRDLWCGRKNPVPGFSADEDLPTAYRAADINVVPSVALEGFGLTAAEALACGTASMVTRSADCPKWWRRFRRIWFFAPPRWATSRRA